MRILKEHFYDVVKLYINQVGITIFSFFLYTALPTENDSLFTTLRVIVSVFSILFYFALIHNVLWEIGAKDRIRIDSNRCEPQPIKGLFLSLFANAPNLILALTAIIFGIIYVCGGVAWASPVFVVVFIIVKIHAAMYMGVVQGVTPAAPADALDIAVYTDALMESVWFFVLPLVAIGLAQLSYWLGTKEIKIFGFMSSGKPKDNSKK